MKRGAVIYLFILIALECVFAVQLNTSHVIRTWVANTFAIDSWVNYNVSGFYVLPNGTTLVSTTWDEGGREVGVYENGVPVGLVENTHGWFRSGGDAVTSDGTYIYFGTTQADDGGDLGSAQWPFPPLGTVWYLVRRAFLDGTTAYYGEGSAFMAISTDITKFVTGLAVSGDILYVSRTSVIELYNTTSNELITSWPANDAAHLALDASGNIWVSPAGPGKISVYTPSGTKTETSVSVNGGRGLDVHRVTGQLMVVGVVTNGKTAPNITVYNIGSNKQLTLAGTFGKNIYDFGGLYGDDRMENLVGVGSDSSGNIYIAMCLMGSDIRAYSAPSPTSATSTLLWKAQGLEWLSVSHYNPVDDLIYGPSHKYNFAHNSIGNGTEWSVHSSTFDYLSYPWDPRGNWSISAGNARIHYIAGQKFMSLIDMYVSGLLIYRFEGEIAILCVALTKSVDVFALPNAPVLSDESSRYLWTDANGNSYPDADEFTVFQAKNIYAWSIALDSNGTIWETNRETGIEAFYYMGLTSAGVPKYSHDPSSYRFWPNPPNMIDCQRSYYIPETDTMYLSGDTKANTYNANANWGDVGAGLQTYYNWTSTNGTYKLAFEFTLPNTTQPDTTGPAYRAGDILDGMFFGADGYFARVGIYNVTNGRTIDIIDPIFVTGWVDMNYGLTVNRRSNGDYIVILEEDEHNKNSVFIIGSVLPPTPPPTPSPSPKPATSTTAHSSSTTSSSSSSTPSATSVPSTSTSSPPAHSSSTASPSSTSTSTTASSPPATTTTSSSATTSALITSGARAVSVSILLLVFLVILVL